MEFNSDTTRRVHRRPRSRSRHVRNKVAHQVLLYSMVAFGVSCTSVEEDNRICLDWESREVVKEKCVPLYGALVCGEEQKIENRCTLWEEIEDEVLLNKP